MEEKSFREDLSRFTSSHRDPRPPHRHQPPQNPEFLQRGLSPILRLKGKRLIFVFR